ncbi:MAG: dynamin family protein [Campylobacterales bacterium]
MSYSREQLEGLIQLLRSYSDRRWFRELEVEERLLELEEFREEMEGYQPKVAVVGEFSTGKSTLINSLIGEKLLPTGFQPTTKGVVTLKYGDPNLVIDREEGPIDWNRLRNREGAEVELYYPAPLLKEFQLIDTPGSNDPSFLTEELLFQLMDRVDLVLFLFNGTQALKESERQLLTQLFRKKDISKFFFILNWIDGVENPRHLKREIGRRLEELLELPKGEGRRRLFLYSAREVLEGRRRELYELFLQRLRNYISKRREELFNSYLETFLKGVAREIGLRVEGLLTQLEKGDQGILKELERVSKEIEELQRRMDRELGNAEQQLERGKGELIGRIREGFKEIYRQIEGEVEGLELRELVESRYLELRIRKLVEDLVEEATGRFLQQTKEVLEGLDRQLGLEGGIPPIQLPAIPRGSRFQQVLKVGGAATLMGVIGGVGMEVYTFLNSIPAVTTLLGVVGLSSSILVPIAGIAGLVAGKFLYSAGRWGLEKIGVVGEKLEEGAVRRKILSRLKLELKRLEEGIISKIREISFSNFREEYIRSRFPQREILEEQLSRLREAHRSSVERSRDQILELLRFREELRRFENV